ncbi:unnamed protein product, partial [Meganyctiphanes norvegica]
MDYIPLLLALLTLWINVVSRVTAQQDVNLPVMKEHPQGMVARRNDPATLNCAASNADTIRWYRDGHEVSVSPDDPRSHRVLLPSGSLFFLRVSAARRDNDAGTYWCVASNAHGAVRSHNATLTVATLLYDFLATPRSQIEARTGQTLLRLPCQPPRGAPPPSVSWLRNGRLLENSSRISTTLEGDLIIRNLIEEDSGLYVCRASNLVGTRETVPARLTVMTSPWFEERPANLTVSSGVMVELVCLARGTPQPTVTWRRLDNKMPIGRTSLGDDQRLLLTAVESHDSGVYVCEAESKAGVAVARATLMVVAAPVITQKPQDLHVVAGENAQLTCHVEEQTDEDGRQFQLEKTPPLVLWRLPNSDHSTVLTAGHSSGRVHANIDGTTLNIKGIGTDDSGFYQCWGVSSGGGVSTQAKVVVVEAHPPPVVGVGPQDILIAPGATATFPCEAVSEASPPTVTWWYRREVHLDLRRLIPANDNPRMTHSHTGALNINDVNSDDDGIYTCRITSATGSVEHSAILRVESNARMSISQKNLPAPPTKPHVAAINSTTVHLTWLPNSQDGDSSRQSYTVEYWRKGWDEWRVADALIGTESCTITDLAPGMTYTFLVRAVTTQGTSFPSPWSDPITVTRNSGESKATLEKLRLVERRYARPALSLVNVTAKAPDQVHLKWEFINTETENGVEGILIYAMDGKGDIQVSIVLGGVATSYLMRGLLPHTEYMFFLVPFWHDLEGTPSNSHTITTPQDVPLSAPQDVVVNVHEKGTVLVTWSGLSPSEARGEVLGYQVTIMHNGSQSLEVVKTAWLEKNDLAKGSLYTVQVAAFTDAGVGPFSAPVLLDLGGPPEVPARVEKDTVGKQETGGATSVLYAPPQAVWLVYLLVPVVILLSIITLLYVRRLKRKASPTSTPHAPSLYQEPLYPSQPTVNMYGEEKLWRGGGPPVKDWGSSNNDEWKPSGFAKDSSLSNRIIRANCLPHNYAEPHIQMQYDTAEPYATTALLVPSSPRGYRASPRTPQRTPWNSHTMNSNQSSELHVNWDAILPPPPNSPPPNDQDFDHLGDADANDCIHKAAGSLTTSNSPHSSSVYDNMDACDRSSSGSSHTYELYTKILPRGNMIPPSPSAIHKLRGKERSRSEISKTSSI